ncbi:pyridoxamine 5'-phosphate oxidase family protein [Streptomyces sp. SID8014]|uniref:pyridoxamine 5'-phosphate oxidase family protein n=1 Tax=Streptomyces sp. SID8014 TaxID=2706097 RepID=UPI0013B905CC|nr:pyridoxamine 5'-phosphate oxidase family protein [Streptomyces sp. SID8014]NEC13319.1 pyridoxamine 5'-phosphate oxidase family protein [Streptomyces sp. SID8014]
MGTHPDTDADTNSTAAAPTGHGGPVSTTLDPRYSTPGAEAVPWSAAEDLLHRSEVFWLSTVRPDGRPHVTPLLAVWQYDALHFATGAEERKARNLAQNQQVILTTGSNALSTGLDLVLEGEASLVGDSDRLTSLATAWSTKYGPDWTFEVADGTFQHSDGAGALVFAVRPHRAFGFTKGDPFSQTRWDFG